MDVESFVYQYEDERHVRLKIQVPGQETDLVFDATDMSDEDILEMVEEKINKMVPKLIRAAKLEDKIEDTIRTVEVDITQHSDLDENDVMEMGDADV